MYAVIDTGGKQYRVQKGDTLKIETLPVEAGQNYSFEKIHTVGEGSDIKQGKPYLDGAKVTAEVISHGRGKKIHIVKFKRRKHHDKWQGHRQNYTEVKITDIQA